MTVHVLISGRVQGVGFRHFTRTQAESHRIKGWVKNLDSGKVEAVFEGSEDDVQALLNEIRNGPAFGKVSEMEVEQRAPEHFRSFEVLF